MSKPDFVPDEALFYATDGANTLYAASGEDILDVWIESDNMSMFVELSRERARKVAQALLRWTDGETGPEEI